MIDSGIVKTINTFELVRISNKLAEIGPMALAILPIAFDLKIAKAVSDEIDTLLLHRFATIKIG